jgi:hypothetical protein
MEGALAKQYQDVGIHRSPLRAKSYVREAILMLGYFDRLGLKALNHHHGDRVFR